MKRARRSVFLLSLAMLPTACDGPGRVPEAPAVTPGDEAAEPGLDKAAPLAARPPRSCDFRRVSAADISEPASALEGCPLYLPSPDGALQLRSHDRADGMTELSVVKPGGSRPRRIGIYETPTGLIWPPGSDFIIVNDQKGSGQSSYLEIVGLGGGRVTVSTAARRTLADRFRKRFRCRLADEFIMTSGSSWRNRWTAIVEVQANLHSGGCPLDPHSSRRLTFLLDARNGRVVRELTPSG
jgi:hypothetical protein